MKVLLARIVVLAVAFLVVGAVMDSVTVSGGFLGALGLAVVYGLVSAVVGTLLRLLTFPLILVTVGLFEFVINALLLLLTEWLTDWIRFDGFWSALGAALILTLVSMVLGFVLAIVFPDTRES